MTKLLWTLAIIFLSLAAGYCFQQAVRAGRIRMDEASLTHLRQRMQRVAMFVLIPSSAMLSLWGLPALDVRLLAMPLLGITAWSVGGGAAMLIARWRGLPPRQAGSLFCCGCFSNIGAVGALVCVVFIGEKAIALVAMYRICEELFYFSIGYPIAQWYSQGGGKISFRSIHFDPVIRCVLLALGTGIALNIGGIPRPEICGVAASGIMILATIFFLAAIGMGLRLEALGGHTRSWLEIAAIKFLLVPAVVGTLAFLLGLGGIDHGLPLRVALILSTMPVAMLALVPPSLFDLDLDLANACWVFSHFCLLLTLPILWCIVGFLP